MVLLPNFIHLKYQMTWDATVEGRLGNEDRFSLHPLSICLKYMEKDFIILGGMPRF